MTSDGLTLFCEGDLHVTRIIILLKVMFFGKWPHIIQLKHTVLIFKALLGVPVQNVHDTKTFVYMNALILSLSTLPVRHWRAHTEG